MINKEEARAAFRQMMKMNDVNEIADMINSLFPGDSVKEFAKAIHVKIAKGSAANRVNRLAGAIHAEGAVVRMTLGR